MARFVQIAAVIVDLDSVAMVYDFEGNEDMGGYVAVHLSGGHKFRFEDKAICEVIRPKLMEALKPSVWVKPR